MCCRTASARQPSRAFGIQAHKIVFVQSAEGNLCGSTVLQDVGKAKVHSAQKNHSCHHKAIKMYIRPR